jgi:CRISPR/Cas system-associated protein Cas10 (large subunit of type III CRISPR-Cas system)
MRKLTPEELANFFSYKKRGSSNLTRCKLCNISLNMNETPSHNLKMIDVCRSLYSKDHVFITEAVPVFNQGRRIDIVDLSDQGHTGRGFWIEIEVSGKQKIDADKSYILRKDLTWEIKES